VLSKEEKVRIIRGRIFNVWQTEWIHEAHISGKGMHLLEIKQHVKHWPWSCHKMRVVETAMAKLRLGHVGLNQHLYRFNMSDTQMCQCGQIESINHFLFQCPKHIKERNELKQQLQKLKVTFNLKNILGGGDYPADVQHEIVTIMAEYLMNTNKMYII
jgi:hypothetical protein